MPNRIVLPDLPDITAEEIARCLQLWIEADERPYPWLAKKVGVGDTRTLKSWIEERPDLLPVDAWLAALAALGRTGQDVRATIAELRAKAAA